MGCNIYINKKLLIESSVGTLEIIYDIFDEYTYKNNIHSKEFAKFLHEMKIAVESMCTYGFDFAEHIHDVNTIDILITIINECLSKLKKTFSYDLYKDILYLKSELLIYKKILILNKS